MKYIYIIVLVSCSLGLSAQEKKHRSSISFSLGIAHYNYDHEDFWAGTWDFVSRETTTHSQYSNFSLKAQYKYRIAKHLQIGAFVNHIFDNSFLDGQHALEGGITVNIPINITSRMYIYPGLRYNYTNIATDVSPKLLDIQSVGAELGIGFNISPKTSVIIEPTVNKLMRDGRGICTALHAGFSFKL